MEKLCSIERVQINVGEKRGVHYTMVILWFACFHSWNHHFMTELAS